VFAYIMLVVPGWWWDNECSSSGRRVSETLQAIHRGGRSPAGHCEGISTSYQLGMVLLLLRYICRLHISYGFDYELGHRKGMIGSLRVLPQQWWKVYFWEQASF